MKSIGCWILTALSALALVAEAGDTRKSSESVGGLVSEILGELISVEIIKVQVADLPSECRSFKLTSDQVVLFFKKSRVISDIQKRDEYPSYPCYVRGKLNTNKGVYNWEIGGGGSGGFWKSMRSITYFACGDECKELFIEVGPDGVIASGD